MALPASESPTGFPGRRRKVDRRSNGSKRAAGSRLARQPGRPPQIAPTIAKGSAIETTRSPSRNRRPSSGYAQTGLSHRTPPGVPPGRASHRPGLPDPRMRRISRLASHDGQDFQEKPSEKTHNRQYSFLRTIMPYSVVFQNQDSHVAPCVPRPGGQSESLQYS